MSRAPVPRILSRPRSATRRDLTRPGSPLLFFLLLALAPGSDFPVDSESPLAGIHAAVTRQDGKGRPPGG